MELERQERLGGREIGILDVELFQIKKEVELAWSGSWIQMADCRRFNIWFLDLSIHWLYGFL